MYQRATVTMSMRELDRLKVIQAVVDGELRAGLAAERLGRCARQVRRLAQRYRMEGPVGLISRRCHCLLEVRCPTIPVCVVASAAHGDLVGGNVLAFVHMRAELEALATGLAPIHRLRICH